MNDLENTSNLNHIGKTIRQMRNFRSLSQQQLSEKANIRRSTVTDIENGNTNFEINTLVAIASALNCKLDIVLTPND